MTHKIKVQMFGNFRMDYNGAPFVAEKMHKESQFNRMMQALIHYSDCGVAKDKLEEIVIGERDIDAPHTALRVIVYKTKQKLAQLGLPGKNLVYLEGGIYYWTPDIEIEEDAAEFEKLYNEACALEKQMPHEPESAETVCDERIKEIEDNMLELYIKALYLYKGEFLAAYTGETWIAQEARRYHIMFEKIINEAAYILRKRKQFKGLEKLGVYAAKVDPFNEWEELIMEAMVETRRYDEAEELYTDVVDYYLRECGIYPSSRLLEILEKYNNQMNHAHEILENIQEGMNEQEETERGGYFCSYPVFRGIYQNSYNIFNRTIEQNGLKQAARECQKGIISFSPLAQGMLTDRYINGIPEDSRIKTDGRFLNQEKLTPHIEQIKKLNDIAAKRGETLAQMALKWVVKDDDVTSVLVGASKPQQILENLKVMEGTGFSEEELRMIDEIVGV